jgi:hypothetical protein
VIFKLRIIRGVTNLPIASTREIIKYSILVRKFQGRGSLTRSKYVLKIILKGSLTVRLTRCKAEDRVEVAQDRV